jgi:hypothetical protein
MKKPISSHESGFTMVVIAALFVAFAIIAAVAVERNTIVQQITRRDDTSAQLNRIANAIIEYSVFNKAGTTNLYPCPARLDLDTTNADFGRAQDDGGAPPQPNCHSTLPGSGITLLAGSTIKGMVPVQTLSQYGVGINDAFDAYNNRILYIVNRTLTPNGTPNQAANPTIAEPWAGYALPAPDFILISLGKDGVGATRRGSTSVAIACAVSAGTCTAAGVAADRLENCDDTDASFCLKPTYTVPSATTATYFDDILTFYRQ